MNNNFSIIYLSKPVYSYLLYRVDPCSLEICTKASILLFIFTSLSKSSMFFSLNFFHRKREVVTCQFVFIVDQHVT